MFRLYFLTFHGEFRGTHNQKQHLHEAPATMTIPLVVLAVLSTIGGFIGMPDIFHMPHFLNEFLKPISTFADSYRFGEVSHTFEYLVVGVTLILLAVVIYGTFNKYVTKGHVPAPEAQLTGVQRLLANKFYVDEFYDAVITKPMNILSKFGYNWIEKGFIDRIVNSFGQMTNGAAGLLRYTQSGHLGIYLFGMIIAIIVILVFKLII